MTNRYHVVGSDAELRGINCPDPPETSQAFDCVVLASDYDARVGELLIELRHAKELLEVASPNTEVENDDAWHDAKDNWLEGYPLIGSEPSGCEK